MGAEVLTDTESAVAPEAAPESMSPLGAFCRRHDVMLSEAIWFGAHVVFDVLILLAWAIKGMPQAPQFLAVNLGTMAGVLLLRPLFRRADRGVLWILRHWYPVTFYGVFFFECGALVPALNFREWDVQLANFDHAMWGGNPVDFFARLHLPVLSEYLQFCYALYYFIPLTAGGQIMYRLGVKRLSDGIAITSVAFYGSYAGYFLFPAVGPRFFPPFEKGLSGLWSFDYIRTFLANSEGRMHDCMPSGHTSVTLITLYFAWRVHRPTFWAILPFASGLVISTMYLRYHYVIDVVVAIPFTVLSLFVGRVIVRAWDRFTGSPGAPELLGRAESA
jgi:hypothetical protein